MDVTYINNEYTYNLSIWQAIRDCISGEKAIKEKDYAWANSHTNQTNALTGESNINTRPIYLPMPNPGDQSNENKIRYAQYIQRASFYGATSRTLNGMMGMVFKSSPEVEFPTDLKYLEDNVDGSGVGIIGQSHEVVRDVISVGRIGLYVDYPQTDGETTRAEVENSGIRATINTYDAESILDWDCMKIGASMVLSYVKLLEIKYERDEDYSMEEVKYYRCLFLENIDGNYVYVVRVYDDGGELLQEFAPRDGAGDLFNHIPFYFAGSLNNRPNVDDAPLQEIADLNIKHYRNSADFEESAFIVGQPTLFVGGFNESWMETFYKNGIPNSMPQEGMKHKESQMISLGARLITDGGQAETAEAARIKHEADVSSLSIAVSNVNKAYSMAIKDVASFTYTSEQSAMSAYEDSKFEIKTAFFDTSLTPEQAAALVTVWQSGAIDKATLDLSLKSGRIIPESTDLEDMNDNISNEMSGLNLDG